jgi:malate dehydrogenase
MLPCTAFLEGEYGWEGIFFGVPVMLGMTGIEKIIELKLTDEEKKAINTSAQDVKQMINEVDQFLKEG